MNRDLSHDLRIFAEQLSAQDFKALSSGIGLGAQRAQSVKRFHLPSPPKLSQTSPSPASLGKPPAGVEVKPPPEVMTRRDRSRAAGKSEPGGKSVPFMRKLTARSLDASIVVTSLIATSCTVFYLLEPASFTWKAWSQWMLARWLNLVGPVELAVGVLVVLGAYTLLFRLLAGATLGELFLGMHKSKAG